MIKKNLFGLVAALGFLPSCSAAVEDGSYDDSVVTVDPTELATARENQESFEAAGFVYEGRVWLSRKANISFFSNDEGARMRLPVVPGTKEGLALLREHPASPALSFEEYVATFEHARPLSPDSGDVLVFEPEVQKSSADGIATEQGAIVNQFCNLPEFERHWAEPLRWHGRDTAGFAHIDTELDRFKHYDQTTEQPLRWWSGATNVSGAVCGDVGPAILRYTQERVDGSVIRAVEATANQGNVAALFMDYGYDCRDRCLTRIGGFCFNYVADVIFRTGPATRLTARTGQSGGNFHFSGYFGRMEAYEYSDDKGWCSGSNCPFMSFSQSR